MRWKLREKPECILSPHHWLPLESLLAHTGDSGASCREPATTPNRLRTQVGVWGLSRAPASRRVTGYVSSHLHRQISGLDLTTSFAVLQSSKALVHLSMLSYLCSAVKLYPTLQPHRLQHVRLPCPSLSPAVCSSSRLLSW